MCAKHPTPQCFGPLKLAAVTASCSADASWCWLGSQWISCQSRRCGPSVLQRFRPITVEKPKVLLPLVNAPLLEYTLEWLALNQVEEVGSGSS